MNDLQLGLILMFISVIIFGAPIGFHLQKTDGRIPHAPKWVAVSATFLYCVGALVTALTDEIRPTGPLLDFAVAYIFLVTLLGILATMIIVGFWGVFFQKVGEPLYLWYTGNSRR